MGVRRSSWSRRAREGLAVALAAMVVPVLAVPAGGTELVGLRATGRAVYEHSDGSIQPVPFARVQLCDDDFPLGDCDLMAETTTGADGTFDMVGSGGDLEGLPDVYVRVLAESDAGAVQLDTGAALFSYCMASSKVDDYDFASDGLELVVGDLSPANARACFGFGAFANQTQEHRGWQLHDQLFQAFDWTRDNIGTPPKVAMLWPSTLNGVPFYTPVVNQIRMVPGFEDLVEVVFHEYAHHIVYAFAESPIPDYNNDTCDETNPLADVPFFGGHCFWEEEKGSIHWSEGLPEFLSIVMARDLGHETDPRRYANHDGSFAVDIETPFDGGTPASPEGHDAARIEGWTTAILYDLWDAADDDHDAATDLADSGDRVTLDFADIWAAVETDPDPGDLFHNHPVTIEELRDILTDQHPELENRINGLYSENLVLRRGTDLSVRGVTVGGDRAFHRGESFTVGAETFVNGGSTIAPGEPSTTATRIVEPGGGFVEVRSDTVPDLAPGAAHAHAGPVSVPADLPPGGYRIEVCADAPQAVYETGAPGQPFDDQLANCADGGSITVENRPPVADAGGPYRFHEGAGGTLDASGSSDPDGDALSYAWSVPVGLAAGPTDQPQLQVDGGTPDGTYTVTVAVTDAFGATDSASVNVEVVNLAPQVDAGADAATSEGSEIELSVSASDPGGDPMAATVDWGDGSTPQDLGAVSGTFTAAHTYADDGTHTVQVCVRDDAGAEGCDSATVTVTNVAPTVTALQGPGMLVVGAADAVTATFSDPGADSHAATFDWGDANSSTLDPAASPTGAVHAWADPGSYTVEACVSDDDGGIGCGQLVVQVLTAQDALTATIADLDAADPAVAAALVHLDGPNQRSRAGASDRLADGDFVAAVRKLYAAVGELQQAATDTAGAQRFLALVGESIARDRYQAALALGLTDPASVGQLAAIEADLAAGRAAADQGDQLTALGSYLSATRRAEELLA